MLYFHSLTLCLAYHFLCCSEKVLTLKDASLLSQHWKRWSSSQKEIDLPSGPVFFLIGYKIFCSTRFVLLWGVRLRFEMIHNVTVGLLVLLSCLYVLLKAVVMGWFCSLKQHWFKTVWHKWCINHIWYSTIHACVTKSVQAVCFWTSFIKNIKQA